MVIVQQKGDLASSANCACCTRHPSTALSCSLNAGHYAGDWFIFISLSDCLQFSCLCRRPALSQEDYLSYFSPVLKALKTLCSLRDPGITVCHRGFGNVTQCTDLGTRLARLYAPQDLPLQSNTETTVMPLYFYCLNTQGRYSTPVPLYHPLMGTDTFTITAAFYIVSLI